MKKRRTPALTHDMIIEQLRAMDWHDQAELLMETVETRLFKEALLRLAIANWSRVEQELRELKERVA